MRIRLLDGLDQLILAGRQVHGLHVEALALDLVVPAHHHHGHIGMSGGVHGCLQQACAGLGRILRRVFAFHPHAQRILHLHAAAGPLREFRPAARSHTSARTSELPPPPVRATAAFGPITAIE